MLNEKKRKIRGKEGTRLITSVEVVVFSTTMLPRSTGSRLRVVATRDPIRVLAIVPRVIAWKDFSYRLYLYQLFIISL
jgi:hypothetical protein